MTPALLRHKETLLIEILLSSLDVRTSAAEVDAPGLVYLSELLIKRTRDELDALGAAKADPAATAN